MGGEKDQMERGGSGSTACGRKSPRSFALGGGVVGGMEKIS